MGRVTASWGLHAPDLGDSPTGVSPLAMMAPRQVHRRKQPGHDRKQFLKDEYRVLDYTISLKRLEGRVGGPPVKLHDDVRVVWRDAWRTQWEL